MGISLACWFIVALSSAAGGELLQNPSFEDIDDNKPAHWDLFIEPMEGAHGTIDPEASDGKFSVMLHNPGRYAVEPANNWSQNILQPLGDKTLTLTGSIKTQAADEAAFWLQCYRKKPWGLLEQKSTADDTPIRGDTDWTPVSLHIKVPHATDFVVVRCVLKGQGSAWFDHLSMTAKDSEPKLSAPPPASPALPKPIETPSLPRVDFPSPPKMEAGQTPAAREPDEQLRKATDSLRKSNESLQDQIKAMKEELDSLREQTRRLKEEAGKMNSEPAPETERPVRPPVPPLVPHEEKPTGKP